MLSKTITKMARVEDVMTYADSLVGLPFRWYVPGENAFVADDRFWCADLDAPTAEYIREQNKTIVCTGLPNLMRRFLRLPIPGGLNGNIRGKYRELLQQFPGGTGAWFKYFHQNKRLQKIDLKKHYPRGTLLIARFKDDNTDQGHLAVVYDNVDDSKTVFDQTIIHSTPTVDYGDRDKFENHGAVTIEPFMVSAKAWGRKYYEYVCLPENWLQN